MNRDGPGSHSQAFVPRAFWVAGEPVMQDGLPDKRRLKLLGRLAYGDVLDVGCHDVQNPFLEDVVGFDLRTPSKLQSNYKRFVQGNCHAIDQFFPPESFDTIIAGELIEHLENPSSFLRGCRQVCKDRGQLLITTPNPYHWTTVIGNLLFVRSGIAYQHINLIPFRAMVALLGHTGWQAVAVKNASGRMRLCHTTRKYFIACPKAIAWQHLYICRKKSVVGSQ